MIVKSSFFGLQAQTDEKAVIGKLHRTIVGLQLKENAANQEKEVNSSKLSRLEAQVLRLNQKCDEKESLLHSVRGQAAQKTRSLFRMIQDLRRQYSGSIPLRYDHTFKKGVANIEILGRRLNFYGRALLLVFHSLLVRSPGH